MRNGADLLFYALFICIIMLGCFILGQAVYVETHCDGTTVRGFILMKCIP